MKIFKKVVLLIVAILALLLFFGVWYTSEYAMNEAESIEVNSPSLEQKVLIATQGSDFKDEVTHLIVDYYKGKPVFLKVIDVKMLEDIDPESYNAILVMHTWEYSKPPKTVNDFIGRSKDFKEKIVVLTTSGEGSYKMKDVDAISGESILENAQSFSDRIILKVDSILEKR